MSRLQTSGHRRARTILRVSGLVAVAGGLLLLLVGLVSFLAALSGGGPPRLVWCIFLGLPLLFVGTTLCMLGFVGAVARYFAAEQVPVATDAVTDMADGTQGAVKTIARAVAEGVKEARAGSDQHHDASS